MIAANNCVSMIEFKQSKKQLSLKQTAAFRVILLIGERLYKRLVIFTTNLLFHIQKVHPILRKFLPYRQVFHESFSNTYQIDYSMYVHQTLQLYRHHIHSKVNPNFFPYHSGKLKDFLILS